MEQNLKEENNRNILLEAEEILSGSRDVEYGDPVSNFCRISRIASVMCGHMVTPSDCCKVLMAVKIAREVYKHKRDNLVDLVAYAEILNRMYESETDGQQQ